MEYELHPVTQDEQIKIEDSIRIEFRDAEKPVTHGTIHDYRNTVVAHLNTLFEIIQAVHEREGDDEPLLFIGSVFVLFPSGKYYMPWTTNQTICDVAQDTAFMRIIDERGLPLENGEGDPCDIFFRLRSDDDDD